MASLTVTRPDPDQLLAQLRGDAERATRGKLRIYFGASAGVGKTYAMLNAAHRESNAGREVLVGVVETHGRSETAALLTGLEVLPRKDVSYRGRALKEFDLFSRRVEFRLGNHWFPSLGRFCSGRRVSGQCHQAGKGSEKEQRSTENGMVELHRMTPDRCDVKGINFRTAGSQLPRFD